MQGNVHHVEARARRQKRRRKWLGMKIHPTIQRVGGMGPLAAGGGGGGGGGAGRLGDSETAAQDATLTVQHLCTT